MKINRFLDSFRVHGGLWLIAIALAIQVVPIFVLRIKGGLSLCFLFLLGAIFCSSGRYGVGFFDAISRAFYRNRRCILALIIYYCFVIAGWFYAPYELHYSDISHIWKVHLLNIIALTVSIFLAAHPQYVRFIVYIITPFILYQCFITRTGLNYYGGEARSFSKDADHLGLVFGGSATWQVIAMYAMMLPSIILSERNPFVKGAVLLVLLYVSYSIYIAGFATPLALFLIGFLVFSVCYLRYGKRTRVSGVVKLTFVVISIVIVAYVVVKIAGSTDSNKVTPQSIASRFRNFIDNPMSGGYDEEHSRFRLMAVGWESFLRSPIIGRGGEYPQPEYETCGGHHAIVDFLGMYGIIGAGCYYLFLIISGRVIIQRYRRTQDWVSCSSVAIYAMYLIGGIVNPMWMGPSMTMMLVFCVPFEYPMQKPQNYFNPPRFQYR